MLGTNRTNSAFYSCSILITEHSNIRIERFLICGPWANPSAHPLQNPTWQMNRWWLARMGAFPRNHAFYHTSRDWRVGWCSSELISADPVQQRKRNGYRARYCTSARIRMYSLLPPDLPPKRIRRQILVPRIFGVKTLL